MIRINGFLFLDELPEENFSESKYSDTHKWVTIDNEKYYFKYCNDPYSELIAYEIAKLLDIPAIEYDLAIYDNVAGVISKDFHKKDCEYIPGFVICNEYFLKHIKTMKKMGLENVVICDKYNEPYTVESNNLENIWQALEYKYQNYPKWQVCEVMYKIVEQFIYMLLTDSPDKGSQNWEIEQTKDKIDLVPLYDNECIYAFPNSSMGMSVGFEDIYLDIKDIIEKFLKVSSSEYIELFLQKFSKLKEFGMEQILQQVEKKIECEILFKETYINDFNNHIKLIESILKKLGLNDYIRR